MDSFEQGPIRPPSEAGSLLIRVTKNCPWNRCAFCHTYRGTRFEMRTVDEVKGDIIAMENIADDIQAMSHRVGDGGMVTDRVAAIFFDDYTSYNDCYRSVAQWLYFGGETVFLQDADSLVMKTDRLAEIIRYIYETFPTVTRVTSYCRSKTAGKKSPDEFRELKEAGLSRIHIGLESGSDAVLSFIRKGVTAKEHIAGGQKIMQSGISLSEYVIPGLGGETWSREHAVETARTLNAIDPDFIRLRSLQVRRNTDLYDMMKNGDFIPLRDESIVDEIRLFIEHLEGIHSHVVSDHILNLLEEIEGSMPDDKEAMIGVIDRYYALSEEDRLIYRLGRRKGFYRRLDDLQNSRVYRLLRGIVEEYRLAGIEKLDADLYRTMHHYI